MIRSNASRFQALVGSLDEIVRGLMALLFHPHRVSQKTRFLGGFQMETGRIGVEKRRLNMFETGTNLKSPLFQFPPLTRKVLPGRLVIPGQTLGLGTSG
jgi:hypothetical protein